MNASLDWDAYYGGRACDACIASGDYGKLKEVRKNMNNRDILKKLVMDQLCVNDEMINNNSRFVEDLGADELDRVELIIAMEDEFGIAIEESDAEKLLTFGDALEYVEKRLSNKDK